MRALLAIVIALALTPVGAAAGYDAHVVVDEDRSRCEGERETTSWAWDDGTTRESATSTDYEERCVTHDDEAGARLERDGDTLVAVGKGERFEGNASGWDREHSTENDTSSTQNTRSHDSRNGEWSRGAYAQVGDDEARLDTSRCEGSRSRYASMDRSDENVTYWNQTSRSEACQRGAYATARDADASHALFDCTGWGYDWEHESTADPETNRNSTYDYRSCSWSHDAEAAGASVELTYWEGHLTDCYGEWNGTAHETRCAWYGGEWSGVRIQLDAPWLPRQYRAAYVPHELGLLA